NFGLDLWLSYNQRLMDGSCPKIRLITDFDNYFTDPHKELHMVLSWIGLPVCEEKLNRACETISHSLRHHHITDEELSGGKLLEECSKLYMKMRSELPTAVEQGSEKSDPLYLKAIELFNDNKDKEAVEALSTLIQSDPEHALAHNDLGAFYYWKGKKQEALFHFRKSVELNQENHTAQKNLADLYLELGKIDEAIEIFKKIISDNPDDTETLLAVADLLNSFGMQDDARSVYEKILQIDPENIEATAKINELH
ncbi:MAG: tetratricopeptide repeat protein, partial [Deltaproteobacteria bacterium]|nr:tetratricopeptide repeat protein [Deltaproteobacteria bacterium]